MIGSGEKPIPYYGLDIIRFVAAIAVVIFHLSYYDWHPSLLNKDPAIWLQMRDFSELARWGAVGVQVFFVLSGFVIAFSANRKSIDAYVKGRVSRVYPAVWICATISMLFIFKQDGSWNRYIVSMILWPGGPFVSGVYWTLAIEITFYLAVAVFVWNRWKIENLGWILGACTTIYYMAKVIDTMLGRPIAFVFDFLESGLPAKLGLLQYGAYFAVGIYLWAIRTVGFNWRRLVWLGIFTLACIVPLLSSGRYRIATEGGAPWRAIELPLFWLLALGLIIASVACNGWIGERLSVHGNVVRKLGLLTYPIYLVHSEVGMALVRYIAPQSNGLVALVFAISAIIMISLIILRVEILIRVRLTGLWGPPRPLATPVAQLP